MKIKNKFILGFLIIIALFSASGYFTLRVIRTGMVDLLGKTSEILADSVLGQIDQDIYSKIELVQVFTKSPAVQGTIIASNREFEKLDNRQAFLDQRDHDWVSVPEKELTLFMEELINNALSDELRIRTAFLREKYGYDVFSEVFITNRYGANVAQTGKTSDYRQDDEAWWQRAKTDGIYVSDVTYDASVGIYSLSIGVRIDDEAGHFSGVIKGVMNIREVTSIFGWAEKADPHSKRNFKLIDDQGRILYATEKNVFLERIPDSLWKLMQRRPSGKRYFIAPGDRAGEGQELFSFSFSKGYKGFPGLGWCLLIDQESEEIFMPVAQRERQLAFFSLMIGILALVGGYLIFTPIVAAILKLKNAVAEIGKGNLDYRIEIKSQDEINQLAATFNRMAEDLGEERKALNYERERLRITFQSIGDGVIATDKEGKITLMNGVAVQLTGWPLNEAVGRPLFEIFHIINEKTRERCVNPVEKVIDSGKIVTLENNTVLISKDGTERIIADSGSPIRDDKGSVIGVVLVFRDNTEKGMAEQERRKLSMAVEYSPSGILITDTQGIVEYVNPMFTQMTGYTAEEIVKTKARILRPDKLPAEEYGKLWETISFGGTWSGEFRNKKKNEEAYWELVIASPVKDARGEIVNFLIIAQDITQRKLFEQRLEDEKKALEVFHESAVHQELNAIALKKEVNELLKKDGLPIKYTEIDQIEPLLRGTEKRIKG